MYKYVLVYTSRFEWYVQVYTVLYCYIPIHTVLYCYARTYVGTRVLNILIFSAGIWQHGTTWRSQPKNPFPLVCRYQAVGSSCTPLYARVLASPSHTSAGRPRRGQYLLLQLFAADAYGVYPDPRPNPYIDWKVNRNSAAPRKAARRRDPFSHTSRLEKQLWRWDHDQIRTQYRPFSIKLSWTSYCREPTFLYSKRN